MPEHTHDGGWYLGHTLLWLAVAGLVYLGFRLVSV